MLKVDLCRSSHLDIPPHSHGLWSLWDMMDLYGYRISALIHQMKIVRAGLADELEKAPNAIAPSITTQPPTNLATLTINIAASLANELGLESTKHQIVTLSRTSFLQLSLDQFLEELRQLDVRLEEDLKSKSFLFVPSDMAVYWQKKDAFNLGNEFSEAHSDIEEAGNCLAIGQGTACILHLDRAMEIALHKLATAKHLQVEIGPRDTWGSILSKMTPKIEKMPENTRLLKDKKQAWSEARTHLFHIKECWRDRPAHGHESYSPARAKEIFEAVRVFMNHFATL